MSALIIGTVLALAALSFVLYPLLVAGPSMVNVKPTAAEPASESPQNSAVEALREIEFDRATGKLSDSDYSEMKESYTRRAIEVMRGGTGTDCENCGPRPETDARYCSNCGLALAIGTTS
ncbi:MAG: hypothetical protein H0T48_00030 [Gemmatimonadaceae bacterium]|nr:hypothetical protein [Gemmatimonadaceae bacterium]